MRLPVELTSSAMQTLHLQHRCRGGYRRKARASYVDESLFGDPTSLRPAPPDFDPPWVEETSRTRGVSPGPLQATRATENCASTLPRDSTPALTPRKKNKYRLIGHTPSYCDESLFGPRPEAAGWESPWMAKGNAVKLHALFWTPPATPRGSQSPQPRETPLRAVHPAGPSQAEPEAAAGSQRPPQAASDPPVPLPQRRSRSLTHLNNSRTPNPPSGAPHANGPRDPRPSPLGVTFRSPLVTPRAQSISVSVPATPRCSRAPQKPKPPWK
ncbi:PREDICTED: RBPJ-interacting and tubulin-associated protein [Elephantulus edwardii]|uniref:RBPJ-interacting and tubulin-associated protein n=1 Tax=Elephantulus edwardii TaxID=28737 RepID=UPI0003F0BD60|nr:PREDICTED: RBPJ-interacting and tubulin-associated protein [Elephantulus edwardii]